MKTLTIVALFLIALAPAHAYIDAGSGSYILQMTMAGILAFAYTIKLSWNRLKTFFVKPFTKNQTEGADSGK